MELNVSPDIVSLYEVPTYISIVPDFVLVVELPPVERKIRVSANLSSLLGLRRRVLDFDEFSLGKLVYSFSDSCFMSYF